MSTVYFLVHFIHSTFTLLFPYLTTLFFLSCFFTLLTLLLLCFSASLPHLVYHDVQFSHLLLSSCLPICSDSSFLPVLISLFHSVRVSVLKSPDEMERTVTSTLSLFSYHPFRLSMLPILNTSSLSNCFPLLQGKKLHSFFSVSGELI